MCNQTQCVVGVCDASDLEAVWFSVGVDPKRSGWEGGGEMGRKRERGMEGETGMEGGREWR